MAVSWEISGPEEARTFELVWREKDGPKVQRVGKDGFGSVVLKRVAPQAVSGKAELQVGVDGIRWTLMAPLSSVAAMAAQIE